MSRPEHLPRSVSCDAFTVCTVDDGTEINSLITRALELAGIEFDGSSPGPNVAMFVMPPATKRVGPGMSEWVECGVIRYHPPSVECTVDGTPIQLTPREGSVLEALLRTYPEPLARCQLLDWVWGPDFSGDPNVASVYVGYLRKKLGPHRIDTLRNVGFVLTPVG